MNAMLERLEVAAQRQRDFVADVSHDLQSPLAAQRVALEVALSQPDAIDADRLRGEVLRATADMERLVGDLLVVAAMDAEHGHRARADGPRQPGAGGGRTRPSERNGGGRHLAESPAAPAYANADDVRRVVRNLLDNAVAHARARVDAQRRRHRVRRIGRLGAARGRRRRPRRSRRASGPDLRPLLPRGDRPVPRRRQRPRALDRPQVWPSATVGASTSSTPRAAPPCACCYPGQQSPVREPSGRVRGDADTAGRIEQQVEALGHGGLGALGRGYPVLRAPAAGGPAGLIPRSARKRARSSLSLRRWATTAIACRALRRDRLCRDGVRPAGQTNVVERGTSKSSMTTWRFVMWSRRPARSTVGAYPGVRHGPIGPVAG